MTENNLERKPPTLGAQFIEGCKGTFGYKPVESWENFCVSSVRLNCSLCGEVAINKILLREEIRSEAEVLLRGWCRNPKKTQDYET